MAALKKVSKTRRQENIPLGVDKNIYVRSYEFDEVVDRLNSITITDGALSLSKGTVTQLTAITTGVTLNYPAGVITTVSSTLAAGSNGKFTLTNSYIAADSVVLLTVDDSATAGLGKLNVETVAAGSCVINITNIHTANAFNNLLKVHYTIV